MRFWKTKDNFASILSYLLPVNGVRSSKTFCTLESCVASLISGAQKLSWSI